MALCECAFLFVWWGLVYSLGVGIQIPFHPQFNLVLEIPVVLALLASVRTPCLLFPIFHFLLSLPIVLVSSFTLLFALSLSTTWILFPMRSRIHNKCWEKQRPLLLLHIKVRPLTPHPYDNMNPCRAKPGSTEGSHSGPSVCLGPSGATEARTGELRAGARSFFSLTLTGRPLRSSTVADPLHVPMLWTPTSFPPAEEHGGTWTCSCSLSRLLSVRLRIINLVALSLAYSLLPNQGHSLPKEWAKLKV